MLNGSDVTNQREKMRAEFDAVSVKGLRSKFQGGPIAGPQRSAPVAPKTRRSLSEGLDVRSHVRFRREVAETISPREWSTSSPSSASAEKSRTKSSAMGTGMETTQSQQGGSSGSRTRASFQEEHKRFGWRVSAKTNGTPGTIGTWESSYGVHAPGSRKRVGSDISGRSGFSVSSDLCIRRMSSEHTGMMIRQSHPVASLPDESTVSQAVNFETYLNKTDEGQENAVKLASTLFEVPCKPLSVSGGTAAFYRVTYRVESILPGTPLNRYVGKDVARAKDEVAFYSVIKEEMGTQGVWVELTKMMCESPGVVVLPCYKPGQEGATNLNLLLLENMFAGFNKMRLCDIKLGEETAIANWKGKSWFGSVTNQIVDQRTNSAVEGLRLEGMDNPSQAVETRLYATVNDSKASTSYMTKNLLGEKVIKKIVLQRFAARDILAYWLDLSSLGEGYETRTHDSIAQVLEEFTKCIHLLAQIPWPQPWIGSSLGLGMEASDDVYDWDRLVVVKLFDWGRAELYRQKDYESLSREDRRMCIFRWRKYMQAMCRVHWEIARIFAHRCCCNEWESLVFEVAAERTVLVSDLMKVAKSQSELRTVHIVAAALMPLLDNEYLEDEGVEVRLPLMCSADPLVNTKGPGEGIGFLHAHIQITNTGGGTMTTVVSLGRCLLKEYAVENLSAHMVTIRVLAFANAADARQHVEAINTGKPEPLPSEYSIDQSTVHGRNEANTFHFSSRFEFVSYPPEATDEVKKLLEKNCPSSSYSGDRLWPDHLPPPYLAAEEHREMPFEWFSQLCPWIALPGGSRLEWKSKPAYKVGEDVEKLDSGSGAWLPAMVLANDLVVVSYLASDGTSMTKALPSDHQHIRPSDRFMPFYLDGDEVEVWSSSQNKWIQGTVVEDDSVIVTYHGSNGDRTKRIPAVSEKLRPLRGDACYSKLYGTEKLNDPAYSYAGQQAAAPAPSPMRRLSDFLNIDLGEDLPQVPRSASHPQMVVPESSEPVVAPKAKKAAAPSSLKKPVTPVAVKSSPAIPTGPVVGLHSLPTAAVAATKFLHAIKPPPAKAGMTRPKAPGAKASAPPSKTRSVSPKVVPHSTWDVSKSGSQRSGASARTAASSPAPAAIPSLGGNQKAKSKPKAKTQAKGSSGKQQDMRPLMSDVEDNGDDSD